jgi:hypothetical protein
MRRAAAARENAWAASTLAYSAKALGVARSDLAHCADLQATLRPEISTSGVLSLLFIRSVFYASLISDVDYAEWPAALKSSRRRSLLREERTSIIRCLRSAFDPTATLSHVALVASMHTVLGIAQNVHH